MGTIVGWNATVKVATSSADLAVETAGTAVAYAEEFDYTIDEGVITHHGIGARWADGVAEGPKTITGTLRKLFVTGTYMTIVKTSGVQADDIEIYASTENGGITFSGVRFNSFAYRLPVADWYTEEITFTAKSVD